ncbi:AraC family transcriptional regulator [Oleiharenicola lentus]|uniref:AraC family transcriptional regulator n=1 Tax=Oleiharenicola lentus TaxID=2508720 RepID=UPI003F6819DF
MVSLNRSARAADVPLLISPQVSGSRYVFTGLKKPAAGSYALSYAGFEKCNSDYLIQRNGFSFHVLELVTSGQGSVTMNGKTFPLRPGVAYLYTTETQLEISTDPKQPITKYFLCFSGSEVLARFKKAGILPNQTRQLALFPEVQTILEDLLREGQHQRWMMPSICEALTEVMLLKIEDLTHLTAKSSDEAEQQFLRCKGIIDNRCENLANLGEIVQAARVDVSQLCRLFRRYQGSSPYQYLLRRKMTLAAEYLIDSNCLVKEAAQRVGFDDPYHFSRCFKKIHGLAPREFQSSLQRV